MKHSVKVRRSESGFSMLALIIAVPLLAMMLWTMGTFALSSLRNYNRLRAETELTSELTFAMERICRDLSYAESAEMTAYGLKVATKQNNYDTVQTVTYTQDTAADCKPIRRNSQPITGDSDIGRVVIKEFACRKVGPKTIEVAITGEIGEYGLSYRLHTAVTCLNVH